MMNKAVLQFCNFAKNQVYNLMRFNMLHVAKTNITIPSAIIMASCILISVFLVSGEKKRLSSKL